MPKTPVKKAAKKVQSKTKTALKLAKPPGAMKAKAKTQAKAKVKPAAAKKENSGRGFMWKVLEQKQAEQQKRQNGEAQGHSTNPEDRFRPQGPQNGFSRFNGPRRRVG